MLMTIVKLGMLFMVKLTPNSISEAPNKSSELIWDESTTDL